MFSGGRVMVLDSLFFSLPRWAVLPGAVKDQPAASVSGILEQRLSRLILPRRRPMTRLCFLPWTIPVAMAGAGPESELSRGTS